MKRFAFLSFPAVFLVFLAAWAYALPEVKVLQVPKGTTVQSIEAGHFKLKGPSGCVLDVKGYQKAKGQPGAGAASGECGIYDAAGKLVATGTINSLKGGPKPGAGLELAKVPATDYVKIDDEVTWLPATIEFQPVRIFNRAVLMKLCEPPGATPVR